MERNETKTQPNGTVTELASASNVQDITGAVTLTDANSGSVYILKAAAGAAITLPAATSKWNLKFVTGLAFATTPWVLTAPTSVIQGGAIVNSTFVPAANENTITFVATAETLGDFVHLECDGTNIYVNGVATAAGAITFTVV